MHDLIVIGAGPGGYEAAAHAAHMGKKVALVEKDAVGGTCLNVGCIPTKSFLRSARLVAECRHAAAFGVNVGPASLDMAAVVARKDKVVGTLTRGVESMLKSAGVEILRGCAELTARDTVQVGSESLTARNILIATGARPSVPPVPGIDSPAVKDSTGVLGLTRMPASVAIIGGGYIGLEFAGFFAAAGVPVTVVEMLPQVAAGADADIATRLQQALKKSGVVFHASACVTAVDGHILRAEDSAGNPLAVEAELIINATGRVPVVDGLGLEAAGVDFDRRGIRASDQGKTNIAGIWACGDVTGRCLLAHAATREGIVAVNNMFGRPDRMRYDAMPAVIYTHPEVASAGATEQQLKQRGVDYRKAMLPMAVAGRYLVENDGVPGVIKVLVGARYGEVLGVHALGDLASEFIVMAATLIEKEMCVSDVASIVFPHPTVSEALKQALLQAA